MLGYIFVVFVMYMIDIAFSNVNKGDSEIKYFSLVHGIPGINKEIS